MKLSVVYHYKISETERESASKAWLQPTKFRQLSEVSQAPSVIYTGTIQLLWKNIKSVTDTLRLLIFSLERFLSSLEQVVQTSPVP